MKALKRLLIKAKIEEIEDMGSSYAFTKEQQMLLNERIKELEKQKENL